MVAGELIVALVTSFSGVRIGLLLYSVIAANIVGAVLLALGHFGSRRGLRTVEQLGFRRSRDAFAYGAWTRGLPRMVYVLWCAGFLTTLAAGFLRTASGALAFSTLPLVLTYGMITREWPADREGR